MRVEVLSHILENKSQYNPRLLSYGDLPKLKKHENKDAFRNTMNSFANLNINSIPTRGGSSGPQMTMADFARKSQQ